jgi:hypothetical protein
MIEHLGSDVPHHGFSLDMKILKHFIGSPMAKQLYDVEVSTLAQRSTIAPKTWRDWAETSLAEKPRLVPRIPMASRRTVLMSEGFTGHQC